MIRTPATAKPQSAATTKAVSARQARTGLNTGGATARPDRRTAILLAAEKLFAEDGYHAVSIRQIAKDADVPLALVGYYFGQKHELFHAIFERWSYTIEQRIQSLREAERLPHSDDKIQRIVEAFIDPVLQLRASAEGEYYALLITVGLSMQQAHETSSVLRDYFDPMANAFIEVLQDTLHRDQPNIDRATVAWCYQFALGALLHHISDVRVFRLSGGVSQPNAPQARPLLVNFIVHGIRGVVAHPASSHP
jgi:AcrR family transcriptional regulator